MNTYHPNIHFTVEVNPSKFLDTNLTTKDNQIITSVHRKPNKLPTHWISKVPMRYKRNAINGDLNRSYHISMNFDQEKITIKNKFRHAGFPIRFTESVIRQFEEKLTSQLEEEDLIIPEFLFREPSKFVLVEIPFCDSNEHLVKRFLEKLKDFTGNKVDFGIKWLTKKVKHLFHVKDKKTPPSL